MDSYIIRSEPLAQSWKQRVFYVLGSGGLYACLMFCFHTFWPSPSDLRYGLYRRAIGSALEGLIWGVMMSWFLLTSPEVELRVDEQSITSITRHRGWIPLKIRRTVHKGRIQIFRDLKTRSGAHRGLLISDKGELASRLSTGFVFIPNTLPEYEDLRRLAESWRAAH